MVMALINADLKSSDSETMIVGGAGLGLFATVSALCNSLACHGLRQWKRSYLVPWLSFYLLVLGVVSTILLQAIYSQHFLLHLGHIYLMCALFTVFYCWSHVKKQYIIMLLPRPEQVTIDVMRDILAGLPFRGGNNNVVTESPPGDLPPKYEELDFPPQYDEVSMSPVLPVLPVVEVESETQQIPAPDDNKNQDQEEDDTLTTTTTTTTLISDNEIGDIPASHTDTATTYPSDNVNINSQ